MAGMSLEFVLTGWSLVNKEKRGARARVCVCGGGGLLSLLSRLTNGFRSRLPPTLLMKNFLSPEANLVPFTSLWRLTILLPSEE